MKITKSQLRKIIKEELLKEYGRTTSGLPFIDAYLEEIDKEAEEVIKIEDPIDRQWEMARRLAPISGKMKARTEHFVKSLDALVDQWQPTTPEGEQYLEDLVEVLDKVRSRD